VRGNAATTVAMSNPDDPPPMVIMVHNPIFYLHSDRNQQGSMAEPGLGNLQWWNQDVEALEEPTAEEESEQVTDANK
jgi:hypothetical protein